MIVLRLNATIHEHSKVVPFVIVLCTKGKLFLCVCPLKFIIPPPLFIGKEGQKYLNQTKTLLKSMAFSTNSSLEYRYFL